MMSVTTNTFEQNNSDQKFKAYIIFIVIIGAIAGLLFGIDVGVVGGSLASLKSSFNLTDDQQEQIVSFVLIGAVIGSVISGFLSNRLGRRNILLISAFIFTLGALLCAIPSSVGMLLSCRLFLGVAIGVASYASPLYLSEISPKQIRGGVVSLYQLMITIGIFVAMFSDLLFSVFGMSWRWMLGVPAVPAAIMFILILFIPRSPRWLMLKNYETQARGVFKKILHRQQDIDAEIDDIRYNLQHCHKRVRDAFKQPYFLKVVLLGAILQVIQQFTGMNSVVYYAPKIFQLAGFASHAQQMWCSVLVGLINVLFTFVAILFVDRWGRRPILFAGLTMMVIGMALLGYNFSVGIHNVIAKWTVVIAIVLFFIPGFAMSLGPIIWAVCAEIYPLRDRDIGITFSTTSNWVCNTIIAATFLTLLNTLGDANTFWMFTGICVASFIFIFLFCPETKSVSLEQIEKNLTEGKSLRRIGA